jgi:hypothetical protein
MKGLWIAAAIAFLVAGVLELCFLGLSILGTLMGGVMTVGTLAGEFRSYEAAIGPVIFLFYGLWLLATLVAGPTHIVAGGMILAGRRNRTVIWAATALSILPLVTVYCAPTSLIAGILGLLALVVPPAPGEAAREGPTPAGVG